MTFALPLAAIPKCERTALLLLLVILNQPQVRLIDVSEYNPTVEEWRTGRLVANMFYYFAMGLVLRKQKNSV